MANIKISDLTAAAAATGTQEFEVSDSLTSKKVTGAQVLSYVHANTAVADVNGLQTALDGKLSTANGAVGTNNLANDSVTTDKVAAGTYDISISGNAATATSATTADSATNATNLTGTATSAINTSALASGTANSTTFLRGDRTWQSISVPSTDFDGVGSYAIAYLAESPGLTTTYRMSIRVRGYTTAGANLRVNSRETTNNTTLAEEAGTAAASGVFGMVRGAGNNSFPTSTTVTLSGTWRLMAAGKFAESLYGSWGNTGWFPMLWVRIA